LLGMKTEVAEIDREILQLLSHGLKDREIAEACGLSESYVRHRVEGLERRFSAITRFHLGCWATFYGLVEPKATEA
jgi:DNA-binding NarL/FixJ family response regulator